MSGNFTLQQETQNADQLAAEINLIKRQTYEYVLKSSVEIGERLTAAKELVPYGAWSDWLKEKVDYSQSTANNFMRIYKEFSDDQISLSGKTKSQTFGNLTYSQAVALFALPEPQREEFVETHDVSGMSTRELKDAIEAAKVAEAERDQARAETEAARQKLAATRREMGLFESEAKTAEKERDEANKKVLKAQAAADRLRKQLDEANEKLKEMTSAPAEISDEERAEIEKTVDEKYKDRLSQLTLDAQTEKARAEAIAAEKAALETKLKQEKQGDILKLDILFKQTQASMIEMKKIIDGCPEDKRGKYIDFVKATLLKIFGGE